jgi:molybdopterin-guanine dinucleotide biosynthesis protein A
MADTEFPQIRPAGVILAGGRSRRMGQGPKALATLGEKPLLQHVIDRVAPQVSDLMLSVEHPDERLAAFGLPQFADPEPDAGPLAGLLTALDNLGPEHRWLLLVPCDAPFLPTDLAVRLLERAGDCALPAAVVSYRSELQPTFSIWHSSVRRRLEKAVKGGMMAGFKQFLQIMDAAVLEWPVADRSPFFNINDPQALRKAGSLLDAQTVTRSSCSV